MYEYVISVGAGINQLPLIRRLIEQGYKVVAFDQNENAPSKPYCWQFKPISTWDAEKAILWLESLEVKFKGALCFSCGKAIETQQKIIKHFNLKGRLPNGFINLCSNKLYLRKELQSFGLSTLIEHQAREIKNSTFLGADSYIVKECSGIASKNVFLMDKEELLTFIDNDKNKNDFLVQEYLTGDELRVIAFIQNGKPRFIGVLSRQNLIGTFFVGRFIPIIVEKWVKKLLRDLISSFSLKNAVLKIDLIKKDERVEVLEINPEIPGDYFEIVVAPLIYSYSFIKNYINLFLGEEVKPLTNSLKHGYCFDYIYNLNDYAIEVDYGMLKAHIKACFKGKNFRLLQIQRNYASAIFPRSNLDAIFGILHNDIETPHFEVNKRLIKQY
ncbi:MAG: ATP-grasp domain-containing protein [Pelotomaculum sp.]